MVIEGQLLKVMAENTNEGEAAQEELPCNNRNWRRDNNLTGEPC